jgi:hypothetical protein
MGSERGTVGMPKKIQNPAEAWAHSCVPTIAEAMGQFLWLPPSRWPYKTFVAEGQIGGEACISLHTGTGTA